MMVFLEKRMVSSLTIHKYTIVYGAHSDNLLIFVSPYPITSVPIESFLDIDVRKKKVVLKNFNHMFIAIKLCLL